MSAAYFSALMIIDESAGTTDGVAAVMDKHV